MSRFIAIGDIHGCADEFDALLQRVAPTFGDRIVLLGDLVNRGPDSRKVIETARELGAVSLLGNHERRLLHAHKARSPGALDRDYLRTYHELGRDHFAFMASMPLTHVDSGSGILCVHGGFMPNVHWELQCAEVVTKIQVVDRQGMPRSRSQCPYGTLWAALWEGPELVLYGHTPGRQVRRHRHAIGIDTACVRGGRLTAYVYPEDRYVQVHARTAYA